MNLEVSSLLVFLSLLWFFVYWILGGVFFAVITIARLGRLRKVRFSCLFTVLALACGIGAAYVGLDYSKEAVSECLADAENKVETIAALFGCGFAGVLGAFLLGAALLTLGGFILMAISRVKSKPWIDFDPNDEGAQEVQGVSDDSESKFF